MNIYEKKVKLATKEVFVSLGMFLAATFIPSTLAIISVVNRQSINVFVFLLLFSIFASAWAYSMVRFMHSASELANARADKKLYGNK